MQNTAGDSWPRRRVLLAAVLALAGCWAGPLAADSTSPRLAAYYDRFLALCDGQIHEWQGRGTPRRVLPGRQAVALGVGAANRYAVTADGELLTWDGEPAEPRQVMVGVRSFAAGRSGLLLIRDDRSLWRLDTRRLLGLFGETLESTPVPLAETVCAAAVGDGADYYVDCGGELFVRGAAHRGQYGDGRLEPSEDFVATATDVVQVVAHTGHALILKRDAAVWGTGGNRYGPLGRHGYGDKAERWGPVFAGAQAIATGASHSVALRPDGTLWTWGLNWGLDPQPVLTGVTAAAAGTDATIALAGGALWQWGTGREPRRLMDCGS